MHSIISTNTNKYLSPCDNNNDIKLVQFDGNSYFEISHINLLIFNLIYLGNDDD